MTVLRIFVSYAVEDAEFATRLMTDLRNAGVEIITDMRGANLIPAGEQFLREELPRCQRLIVVQTPDALQSPRVQAIVEVAGKYVQQGQMTGVLRVIGPTLNASEVPVISPTWGRLPSFDASQDYPRALARLCLHLGLTRPGRLPKAPPLASHQPPTPDMQPASYMQPPSPQNVQGTSNKSSGNKGTSNKTGDHKGRKGTSTTSTQRHVDAPSASKYRGVDERMGTSPAVRMPSSLDRGQPKPPLRSPVSGPSPAGRLDTKDRPLRPLKGFVSLAYVLPAPI